MKNEDQNQLIQDLFLLQRVAQRINSNLDLEALLEEVVNDVSQTFACSRLAVFLKDFPTAKFVTMVYALLDPKSGSLIFASAGHLPPLLVDSSGAHFLETEAGFPLGTRERSFSERAIEMTAGSRLVFYSDGVTEAMNSSFEEYGEARLREHTANPSASVQSLLHDVRTFTDGYSASDDVTVVMVQACE